MLNDGLRKNLKIALWIFAVIVFQTVVCRYIAVDGIMPDVVFVFVISFVINEEKFSYSLAVPVICGMIVDLLSGRGFGVSIISYTYSALISFAAGEQFLKQRLWFALLAVPVFTVLCEGIYYLIVFAHFRIDMTVEALKEIILTEACYNAAVTVLIYPLLKKTVYTKRTLVGAAAKR